MDTDNVWADTGHEAVITRVAPAPDNLIEPLGSPPKQSERAEATSDGFQQSEEKATLGSKIHKTYASFKPKLYQARWPLLVILGYLCCLFMTFLAIDASATGVRGLLMPSYRSAAYKVKSLADQEVLLMRRRDDLADKQMQKRPFETQPKCLIRAINEAHKHFDNLPYQSYPEIVEYSITWAQSECDRVIFVPVPVPQNGWDKFWKILTENFEAALFRLGDLVQTNNRCTQKRKQTDVGLLSLPPGYQLGCNDYESFCNLMVDPHSHSTPRMDLTSEVDKLMQKGGFIRYAVEVCKNVHASTEAIRRLIPWMNLLGLTVIIMAIWESSFIEKLAAGEILRKMACCSAPYILSELLFLSVYFWHHRIAETDKFSTNITTATYLLHLAMVLLSLAGLVGGWLMRFSLFRDLLLAFQELRTIFAKASVEKPGENDTEQDGATKIDKDDEQTAEVEDDSADRGSDTDSDSSTSSVLRISPDTPLYEDVERMREHLHRKQATTRLGPHRLRVNNTTLAVPKDEESSESPSSDGSWTVLTPTTIGGYGCSSVEGGRVF